MYSAADSKTGIIRRRQSEFATAVGATTRGVQISRDRLVGLGYLEPIGQKPGGYVSAYRVPMAKKANTGSPSGKGEPPFASENGNGERLFQKGERSSQKGEPPFVHDPLMSRVIPYDPTADTEQTAADGPRSPDGLGPLGPLDAELRRHIDPANFEAWLSKARFVSQSDDGRLTLAVPNNFLAQEIPNRFERQILACAPGADRLDVVVQAEPSTVKAR